MELNHEYSAWYNAYALPLSYHPTTLYTRRIFVFFRVFLKQWAQETYLTHSYVVHGDWSYNTHSSQNQ